MIRHDVEQGSEAWLALRNGLPTASEFSKLVTSKGDPSKSLQPFAEKLACDKYAGKDTAAWEGNKFTARGTEIEPEARLAYVMSTDLSVDTVGFITDDLILWGCSPDAEVGDEGLLEIKCLPKAHYKAISHIQATGKAPSDYQVQCQGQLAVTERKWVDLMYYHPDLPSKTVRIYPDEKIQKQLVAQRALLYVEIKKALTLLESMS
jgi:hypothetical protein